MYIQLHESHRYIYIYISTWNITYQYKKFQANVVLILSRKTNRCESMTYRSIPQISRILSSKRQKGNHKDIWRVASKRSHGSHVSLWLCGCCCWCWCCCCSRCDKYRSWFIIMLCCVKWVVDEKYYFVLPNSNISLILIAWSCFRQTKMKSGTFVGNCRTWSCITAATTVRQNKAIVPFRWRWSQVISFGTAGPDAALQLLLLLLWQYNAIVPLRWRWSRVISFGTAGPDPVLQPLILLPPTVFYLYWQYWVQINRSRQMKEPEKASKPSKRLMELEKTATGRPKMHLFTSYFRYCGGLWFGVAWAGLSSAWQALTVAQSFTLKVLYYWW